MKKLINKIMSQALTKIPTLKTSTLKLIPWSKALPKAPLGLDKNSRAGVVIDNQGVPQLFIFDTSAFLDVLSTIDDSLADKLSHQEYHSKSKNPAGWLIDQIEAKLPADPCLVRSLKDAIDEANHKGWVPFSKIQTELGLS